MCALSGTWPKGISCDESCHAPYSLNIWGEGGGGGLEEDSHSHLLKHSQAPTKLQTLS